MKLLNPGDLRHRLELQEQQAIVSPEGEHLGTQWVTVAKVWGNVQALSAKELVEAQAMQSEVVARITIRARHILPTWRILHRGTVYNIAGIVPDPNSGIEWMTLPVSAGMNDGT